MSESYGIADEDDLPDVDAEDDEIEGGGYGASEQGGDLEGPGDQSGQALDDDELDDDRDEPWNS